MKIIALVAIVLLGFSLVEAQQGIENSVSVKEAEEACPDKTVYSGQFENSFGFSAVIPEGYNGLWNSAFCVKTKDEGCVCMGDHGRLIPLGEKARIDMYAGYNTTFYRTAAEIIDSDIQSIKERAKDGSVKTLKKLSAGLGTLQAERIVLQYTDKKTGLLMIEDVTEALRSIIIKDKDNMPSHVYTVSLLTPEADYEFNLRVLEKVLKSWKKVENVEIIDYH